MMRPIQISRRELLAVAAGVVLSLDSRVGDFEKADDTFMYVTRMYVTRVERVSRSERVDFQTASEGTIEVGT